MCPIKSVQYSNIDNSQRPQVNKLSEFLSGKSGSIESHKVSTLRAIACSIYEEYLSQSGSFHIRFSNVRIRASNRSIKGHGMKPAKRHPDLSLMNKWYISSNMHYLTRNFCRPGEFSENSFLTEFSNKMFQQFSYSVYLTPCKTNVSICSIVMQHYFLDSEIPSFI